MAKLRETYAEDRLVTRRSNWDRVEWSHRDGRLDRCWQENPATRDKPMSPDTPNLDPQVFDKASQEKDFWHRLTAWVVKYEVALKIIGLIIGIATGVWWLAERFARIDEKITHLVAIADTTKSELRRDIDRIESGQNHLGDRFDRLLLKQMAALSHQGKILQVDAKARSLTIETIPPEPQKLEVALAPGWKCLYKGKEVKFTDLKEGMYVRVTTTVEGKAVFVEAFDTKEELLKDGG